MATCNHQQTPVQVLASILKCSDCCRQLAAPLIQYPSVPHYFCNACYENRRTNIHNYPPEGRRDFLIENLCFFTTLKCSFSVSGCKFTGATILEVAIHEEFCRLSSQSNIKNENEHNSGTVGRKGKSSVMEGPEGQTLQEALLAEMNCPVCWTRVSWNFEECENGHPICNQCFNRLKICPICRGSKSFTNASVLRRIYCSILAPCINVDNGCKVRDRVLFIISHEKKCEFNEASCPLIGNELCGWRGLRSGVLDHFKACHSEVLTLGHQCSEVLEYKKDLSIKYLYFDGIFFRYRWMKHNGDLYFFINHLEDEIGYSYEMDLTYCNNGHSERFVRSTEYFQNSNSECGVHYLQLRPKPGNFFSDDCTINYVLTVRQVPATLHGSDSSMQGFKYFTYTK